PSGAERVYLILRTLEKLGEEDGDRMSPYFSMAGLLRELWQESLVAVGGESSLNRSAMDRLDGWLDRLCLFLTQKMPDVRYRGFPRALTLAPILDRASGDPPGVDRGLTLPDVLNAAWYCRLARSRGEDLYALQKI